jgi:hypothetical protein
MNIAATRKFTPADPIEDRNSPIHRFFDEHHEALRNTARLLGGSAAINLVDKLIDALSSSHDLSRRTIKHLEDLEELLALENVGDPDRAEAGYFAAIDILDPVVDEICLLTDSLRSAIAVLPEPQRPVPTVFRLNDLSHATRPHCSLASAVKFHIDGKGEAI